MSHSPENGGHPIALPPISAILTRFAPTRLRRSISFSWLPRVLRCDASRRGPRAVAAESPNRFVRAILLGFLVVAAAQLAASHAPLSLSARRTMIPYLHRPVPMRMRRTSAPQCGVLMDPNSLTPYSRRTVWPRPSELAFVPRLTICLPFPPPCPQPLRS